jgi:uncharacterized protein (DUF1786 family)
MKILTVDVGTGTQDILLYDSRFDLENGFKMVLPSPTMIVHQKIKAATRRREAVLLDGVTMGGGPSGWAAEAHLKAGLPLYATPDAARSINDDLDVIRAMGVQLIGEDEARRLGDSVRRIELLDFDFAAIHKTFETFGVSLEDLDAVAVAVFDHGAAPPDVSDRKFRFDYLDERIRATAGQGSRSQLAAFAYPREQVPAIMTRMQAVVDSATNVGAPLIVMDTAPAAVLGAMFDPQLVEREQLIVANVGNFHTLAFRFGSEGIEGVFEHHTGLLKLPDLESLIARLADGSLSNPEVFDHHGHGALMYAPGAFDLAAGHFGTAVTGPRRSMLRDSFVLRPYFAVPFGDMMIAGCFGLLYAAAKLLPSGDELLDQLNRKEASSRAPWDD